VEALYNEIDPFASRWLERLVGAELIAPGRIDSRSVVDLQPHDVAGLTQFHAFAGVGVWSYAARLAGWPDNRPLWTGSCPCQPFSAAGRRHGFADKRHLWPTWFRLIREFPLAHGVAGRVAVARPAGFSAPSSEETRWVSRAGALRGIGNAIVAPLAATFLKTVMETLDEES